MRRGTARTVEPIIETALHGELDETRAGQLHALEPEDVALALLASSFGIVELQGESQGQ